ncbi:MAG: glucose/arabinose dehydrogenase [Planctomycetota bacterium]|jgi:glucose/arabinose dehydrogenase
MISRSILKTTLALALAVPFATAQTSGVDLPPGFLETEIAGGWNQPTDMAFLPDGRLLVAEKAGLVWMVDGGFKGAQAVVDITEEVADISSHGLKGIAVDPSFGTNGNIYLLYEVDRHHLLFFGTPQYDPIADDLIGPTIGRITRLTLDAGANHEMVLAGSRNVLIGQTASTGFPIINVHEGGALRFADDGSLLATAGDGAEGYANTGGSPETVEAISLGIIPAKHDVGPFRAQLVDSLAGTLIRIDPSTGDGLPGNPFYNPGFPSRPRSRVWAYGLRNPFRISVVPGTSTGPNHPGRIIIGDVGFGLWEELNVSETGGENFGWPLYEGMEQNDQFYLFNNENPLAPNPLFAQNVPGAGLCTQEYFTFVQLLQQESANPLVPLNPCDPMATIPASALPAVHTRPVIDWGHIGPARAKTFDAMGVATSVNIGDISGPVAGNQFIGSCSIAGVWYETGNYPSEYDNSFFTADFTSDWIKLVKFDAGGQPTEVIDFGDGIDGLVSLAIDPISGDVYFLQVAGELHRLEYQSGNIGPTAESTGALRYGPAPHRVQFQSAQSNDPEGLPLDTLWDFGDGTPTSALEDPIHIFPSQDITPSGTIIAQVLELVPPQQPTAVGLFPSVIADGVFVNPSTGTKIQNYLTFPSGTVDTDPNDWVGYEFTGNHRFHQLVFQEGMEYTTLGGWFDSLTVQARVAGVWTEVTGLEIFPPYDPNDGEEWETYELFFDAIEGDGIRLFGLGGGSSAFVTVAELRVISDPVVTASTRYDVSMTVTDSVNQQDTDTTPIWINNTPPTVTITSPVNGDIYDPLVNELVNLNSIVSDLESTPGELTCQWEVFLHHNDHVHPEPLISDCDSAFTLLPHGSVNSIFFWEFRLTVSGPLGLSNTVTSVLYEHEPTLLAENYSISLSEGGSANFQLDAGPARANNFYWIFMNATGIWPGINFDSVNLPLNFDSLMLFGLKNPNLAIFTRFLFILDGNGQSTAAFNVPAGSDPSLAGITLSFAYVGGAVSGEVDFASNPTQVTFTE